MLKERYLWRTQGKTPSGRDGRPTNQQVSDPVPRWDGATNIPNFGKFLVVCYISHIFHKSNVPHTTTA